MKRKTILIRIRLRDYQKLRKYFPAMRNETAASYFERLANELNNPPNLWQYWKDAF